MPLVMLMKTTRLIMPSALQTTLKERSPSYRDLPLQFPGNNVLFAFRQTFSWKICPAINCVMTSRASPLLKLGHLQGSPGMAPR